MSEQNAQDQDSRTNEHTESSIRQNEVEHARKKAASRHPARRKISPRK